MEFTAEGQIIQSAEVDTAFKVPRQKAATNRGPPLNWNPVLSNSYNNFPTNQHRYAVGGFNQGWPNQFAGYHQQNMHFDGVIYGAQCHPGFSTAVNALKRPREKPKLSKAGTTYRDSFCDLNDSTLPKELRSLFQPLYCKLCSAQLSSNSMAKLHYQSKNHEKKVRKFLVDHSEKTGEPLHKRALITTTKKAQKESETNPAFFHCDVCDLALTGRLHAESHYMGRNHQKAVAGHKAPAGKGHFNDKGKWVRTVPVNRDMSGRGDGFGLDFVVAPEAPVVIQEQQPMSLYCGVCNIATTSEQQMTLHYNGQKHQKRVKQLAAASIDVFPQNSLEGASTEAISANFLNIDTDNSDMSEYRTPSGSYYCNVCNIALNSGTQFKQHMTSKKHRSLKAKSYSAAATAVV